MLPKKSVSLRWRLWLNIGYVIRRQGSGFSEWLARVYTYVELNPEP